MRRLRSLLVTTVTLAAVSGCTADSGNPVDASIIVSPVNGPITESGGQASFTISLGAKPGADVTFSIASGNALEGTVSPSSVTFTAENFAAPQTILVTGQDDDVADGTATFAITIGAPATDDARYAEIDPADPIVANIDDETAGIRASTVSVATTEDGGQASFTIVLDSQPTADVTLALVSTDEGEGTVSAQSLVFTPVSWNAPQTVVVTGANDALADGAQEFGITIIAASADPSYDAFPMDDVLVVNVDDDTASIIVSTPASAQTTEAAGTTTFTIRLASQPLENVVVSFNTNDATEGAPTVTSRTFTSANYATPQTVTVVGANDAVADGNQPYSIVFSGASSADPAYSGMTPASIALSNVDDETAGIFVTPISGATTEAGGTATFTVRLMSQPTFGVTVNFVSNDLTEGTTSAASLAFTTANFATPQTVTVTGVDDMLLDGNQTFQIAFSATTSSDPKYSVITPANIPVTNIGDDASRKVLIVHASATPAHVTDVETILEATGSFEGVDTFNASMATPTQAELGAYRSLLVMNDSAPWADAALLGDVLANHFDAGNQVVLANFTHSAGVGGAPIGGRFATTGSNGLMLLDAGGTVVTGSATLGTGLVGHFLLRDVTTLSATNAQRNGAAALPGVTVVRYWNDGTPLIVARTFPNGRVRADLNLSAPSNTALAGSWTGDGANLLRNALLYVTHSDGTPQNPPPPGDPTPDVGYYSMTGAGQGDADQVPHITEAGGVPVNLTNLTAADLMGLEVLFVQNPDNGVYLAEYTARLADIDAAVQAGMTLIIHDRFVTSAAAILPGSAGFQFVRSLNADVNVLDATTLVTTGPGGVISNTSLDGGNSSTHGYVQSASLPANAVKILNRPAATEIVTFGYPHGAGFVIYSSIPLDYYLDMADTGVAAQFKNYATNVVAYGIQQSQN